MKGAKILTAVGIVLSLLCGLVLLVFLILPLATDGRTSWEEAMLGVIPSGACCGFSALLALGGVIWLIVASGRK